MTRLAVSGDAGLSSVRELDCRWTNGVHVRLLWSQLDGRVSVAVMDTRSGEWFRVAVRDGERPLDVFQHPFAYGAYRCAHPDAGDGLEAGSGGRRHDDGLEARP